MVKIFVSTNDDGYATGFGYEKYGKITSDPSKSILFEVEEDHPIFSENLSSIRVVGGVLTFSKNEKNKIEKMDKKDSISLKCKEVILSGFKSKVDSIEYHFSYDTEAQINLQDTMRLFDNNMIQSVMWTATLSKEKVRIDLNKEQFTQIFNEGVKQKMEKIAHYRDELIPLIEACQTEEQLEAITWETTSITSPTAPVEIDETKTLDKRIDDTNNAQAETSAEIIDLVMMLVGGMYG